MEEAFYFLTVPLQYLQILFVASCLLSIPFFFNYIFALATYHYTLRAKTKNDMPPELPAFLPSLSNALWFLYDAKNFVTNLSTSSTSAVVNLWLFGRDVFFVSGTSCILDVWSLPPMSDQFHIASPMLKRILGLPEDDNSSDSLENDQCLSDFDKAFGTLVRQQCGKKTLKSTADSFISGLQTNLATVDYANHSIEGSDLAAFVYQHVGSGILQASFAPDCRISKPQFMSELWEFDKAVPVLGKGLPYFLAAEEHKLRSSLISQIRGWLLSEGDERVLKEYDVDMVAKAYLGFAWNTVANTVPMVLMALLHLYEDQNLLTKVRSDVKFQEQRVSGDSPLLQSVYAETLRVYSQTFISRSMSASNVSIGEWYVPKGGLVLVSTQACHMDAKFWNSKDCLHSVREFWGERFLDGSTFTTRDLGGAWIPYGGGSGLCPGRDLANKIALHTCATMVAQFDIELKVKSWNMSDSKFGFGTRTPKGRIPFHLKQLYREE